MAQRVKRIGVLTAGGDCPGLNAVIRAVVRTAHKNGIEVYGIFDGYAGLIEKRLRPLTETDVSGILPKSGTILGTSNRDNPFKYYDDKGDPANAVDVSEQVVKTIEYNELEALVTIGGDGTQSISMEFFKRYGIPVVGVPKTIDNDLGGTDITFGFDSALQIATYAIDTLHATAEAHHRIMAVEVMGRNAGWIALHSGIAGGGDVILLPEIPFKIEKVAETIRHRIDSGKRFSLIVVSEGAKPEGGDVVVKKMVKDASEPIRLGGIGNRVAEQVEELTGIEARVTVLGHLQRGVSPSPFDRILATRFGYYAIDLIMKGEFGHMVGLSGRDIVSVPLEEATHRPRIVEPDGPLVRMSMDMGVGFGV